MEGEVLDEFLEGVLGSGFLLGGADFEKHADLAGIYCAGGGMEGAISALRESGRARDVMLVVNEITDETREALQDGTVKIVVGTPLRQLCAELIPLMVNTVDRGMAETPGQRFLPFEVWTPESL